MYTLLIVDDTKENLSILLELLGEEYDVIPVTNGKEALDIVKEEKIDLILLDVMMPEMDGFEVCKILKEDTETKDIPIIFITAKTDEDSIEKAYEIGGSDYVTKPFRPRELKARVKRELELQKLQKQLKIMATTDSLTGLYNRRHFSTLARHIFDISRRDKKNISILMIDIDKFKRINDTYGHQTGDYVIKHIADILKKTKRESDIACRYGGEEFVILLPSTPIEGGCELARKIKEAVEREEFKTEQGSIVKVTVSIGVSQVFFDSEKNIEPALKRADEALYEAKEAGRNTVCIRK